MTTTATGPVSSCAVGAEPVIVPLDNLRDETLAAFLDATSLAVGSPTGDDDDWRFTDISALVKARFAVAPAGTDARCAELVEQHRLGDEAAIELVFVNGRYVSDLSTAQRLPAGVTIQTLGCHQGPAHPADLMCRLGRCASLRSNRFVALNTCFFRDGLAIHLARGAEVDKPIHLLCLSLGQDRPTINSPRVLVVADDHSTATVVETHAGIGGGLTFNNVVTELDLGTGSHIRHVKLHGDAPETYHIGVVQARLAGDARLHTHSVTLGGDLVRNDVHVDFTAPGGEADLDGLTWLDGTRHAANHTRVDHASPGCTSRELYKQLLDDHATGVFKGSIVVQPQAQRSDARMACRTLLLSEKAVMHALPLLEINADDVKCAHGATTGPVDSDQIFYQRSRGIPEETARRMLGYAFAADVARRIPVQGVRRRIEQRLAAHHGLPDEVVG
jgi:Fe-S cluster assembly protein SufD